MSRRDIRQTMLWTFATMPYLIVSDTSLTLN